MTHTAADVLIEVLADWGVEVVFGLPGDGINGIMDFSSSDMLGLVENCSRTKDGQQPSYHRQHWD
jgi:hypothetical protein